MSSSAYLSYDPFAHLYDQTRVIPPESINDIVRLCGRAARLDRGGLFLDAGVGTGRFAAPLARSFPGQIVGVDVSQQMMNRATAKSADALLLAQADLLRLPFSDNVFHGVLIVHILHLIEQWEMVIDELRRVLIPGGVILVGGEEGGRSILVDYYLQQAKLRGLATDNLGARGLKQPISYLRRRLRSGVLPRVELISGQRITWRRHVPVSETLAVLNSRGYSQMRKITDADHLEILADVRAYAITALGSPDAVESFSGRFVLYSVK